jgi:hypothetical protein
MTAAAEDAAEPANQATTGRANQKARTRRAIIDACRELTRSGAEVTMPDVARAAMVSEATAYRYFPDLATLLQEALAGLWPVPAEALGPGAVRADRSVRPVGGRGNRRRGARGRDADPAAFAAARV